MTCEKCPLNPDCQFDQKRMGGFKGDGPRYVGYRLIADRAENNGAKEDTISCFHFVEALQKRMRIGRQLRDEGKDADLIKIIAQEPAIEGWKHTVRQRVQVGFNLKREIVRPQSHLIEILKKAGYKICMEAGPQSVVTEWEDVEYDMPVPVFAEQQNKVSGYKQSILERELAEQEADDDADDQVYDLVRSKMGKAEAKPA